MELKKITSGQDLRQRVKTIKMKCLVGAWLLLLLNHASGSNILVMLPLPLYSHTNSYLPIFTELAKRGHNVTMVSPFPLKEPIPNFKEITIRNNWEEIIKKKMNETDPHAMDDFFLKVIGPLRFCPTLIENAMNMSELQAFLNDTDSKFDMVITETFFCQEPFIALSHKYGAIHVTIQTISLLSSVAQLTGNPHNPAYVPSFKFPFPERMNFWQRSKNTLVNILETIAYRINWIYMDYLMRQYFTHPGFENLPPIGDMFKNTSLILVDNHISTSYPRPYLPNVIEFGGLIVKAGEKLPEDLETFMNKSKDGVIYFSWGSHFSTTRMKPQFLSALMSAFGKVKQTILMKADQESFPGMPDNVHLVKWAPQASILAHPNLRVFISHGGIHGVLEAINNGVPILGTPIFADQNFNIKVAEEAGFCINVDIGTATDEIILDGINRLIVDPSYKENALKRRRILNDRPMSALDNTIYWIGYVLRHGGAPHLRSSAVQLSWYQYILLDVFAVWGTLFVIVFVSFTRILKFSYRSCKGIIGKMSGKNKKD